MASPRLFLKRIARSLVPPSRTLQLRSSFNRVTWRWYAGSRVHCNVCDTSFRRFQRWIGDDGSLLPMCPRCGSLGRHRSYWLYLSAHPRLFARTPTTLLHIAPEPCLRSRLRALPAVDYVSADLDSSLADEVMDVQEIHKDAESFDAIICNHVLEHVDDDGAALRELHRILRPGGWAMLQVPLDPEREVSFEDASVTDPRERERLFGQRDHVRAYGRDFVERVASAGFTVTVDRPDPEGPDADRLALDLGEPIIIAEKAAR